MLAVLAAAIAAAASPRPVADDHCRFPPSQTAYWRTAPKNFHTNAELLAFASRFNTYEIHVGFNIRVFHYLSRSRTGKKHKEFRSVPGATAEAFAALDFELVIDGAAVAPRPLVRDGHNHTLVVRFPVAARDGPETATLRASPRNTTTPWFEAVGVHVCDERDDASYDLAVCTQIMATDVEHRPDHLAVWLGYHFAQGADRAIVFVDVPPNLPADAWARLAKSVATRLGADAPRARLIAWRFIDKEFTTQQIAEQHCLYGRRGRARYVMVTDVDEFPVPRTGRVVDAARVTFSKPNVAAWRLLTKPCVLGRARGGVVAANHAANHAVAANQVANHAVAAPSRAAVYKRRRPVAAGPLWSAATCGEPEKQRAKLLFDPLRVDYISVHQATTPRGEVVSARNNIGTAVVLNHVRHHVHAAAGPAPGPPACLAPAWRAAWDAYARRAVSQDYAPGLVPRECGGGAAPSGCLPPRCAE